MFPRVRVRPGAEETPEDEEASLLQQRDLTLRSALDQIQQRRRTPRRSPPPRPPPATREEEGPTAPAPHQPQGPLEALRQREWLLNLQEQQELQRLRAPTTPPHQEECPREKEEQLLFNGESPPSPAPTPAPPPKEPPSSPRSVGSSTSSRRGAGGWRRGGSIPASRPPLRGRRGAPPHRFQRGGRMPSYQQHHRREEGVMGSSSASSGPVCGEGKEEEEDWQEKALPRSEQDEASMLAQALELSRLDDSRSRAEEQQQQEEGPPARRRSGGWRACPARPEGGPPPLGVVVGSIDAQQAPVVGGGAAEGVSFDQWLSLCGRYMPLLAQGLLELQRTRPLLPAVPFPPPGWPHPPSLPPPPLPLTAPTAALIAELTGSALRANHCGQLPPPPLVVANAPQGQQASRERAHKSSSRQPSSHSARRQPGSASAQPSSRGRRSQRGSSSSKRKKEGPAASC